MQQDMQAGLVHPNRDCSSGQGRAEPHLLPADPQVPRRRHDPVGLQRQAEMPGFGRGGGGLLGWWRYGGVRFAWPGQALPGRRPQL